ncbi:MBL fold metallo-hydrolase [Halobacterium salinarum]|uniref:MBL fold metallo-hydrolase n=1 Tax=Halobacterium salinarum TaxID=2242 RepID=UPI001F4507F4|nr:MBL fold metallo-hydrolase [Halobacterium salinarum]MCF2239581.1 MBL fold metallo-hydrolase [Halobacterium salinarum]
MSVRVVTSGAASFTCNAFLVVGDTTTLVDAGAYDGVADEIRAHVDALDQVVITHQHTDHIQQLDAVVDAFEGPDVYAYADHPLRTHALADGDTVQVGDQAADVVFTPGHAPDHISLVTETALFAGDVVVHDDGAFDDGSFGRTDMPGQSRERLIGSLRELLARMPDSVSEFYAGHGGVFEGDVRAVAERALDRAQRRDPKYPDDQ